MIKLSALLILLLLAAPPREDDARRQDSLQRARMAEYFMAEDQEGFIKAARELVNYHLEKGSDKQLFDAYATLFDRLQMWGRYDEAMAVLEEMSSCAHARKSAMGDAVTEFCFGQFYLGNRHPQEAQGHYRQAFRALQELGENNRAIRAGFNLQAVAMNLDTPEEGLAINDSTWTILLKMEEKVGRIWPESRLKQHRYRFVLMQRLGRMEEARPLRDSLLHYAALVNDPSQQELVLTAVAQFEQLSGNKEAAYAMLDTLIDRNLAIGNYAKVAQFRLALADFQRDNGDHALAVDNYRLYAAESDSAQLHRTNQQLAELTKKYELNELKMENEAIRERILIYATAFILLLGAGIVLYLIRAKRKDEKMIALLQEANEKAMRADAVKTRFIQNMTHELRTPLNAITGFSQLLALPDGMFSAEEKEEFGGHVLNSTKMMTMLLDDLISSSAMDAGEYKVSMEEADCGKICREALTDAEHRLQSGVELVFEPSLALPFTFRTDPLRVQQVLTNLLTNACKHTSEGRIRLTCSLEENPGLVTFAVEDSGPGIPAAEAERIFKRFVKLDDFVQGTGLGLSICRDIAGRLGGQVWLDTAYSPGARFVFTVPVGR